MDQVFGTVTNFISLHPYATLGIGAGWYLLSIVASSLPSPSQSSAGYYKFFFTFMHSLAGGLARLLPFLRLPSDPSRGSTTFFGKPNGDTPPPPPPAPNA